MKKKIKDSLGDLKDKVKTANEIPIPGTIHSDATLPYTTCNSQISTQTSWITAIEDYCGSNNLLPEDLIAFHVAATKKAAKSLKSGKNEENKESIKGLTNSNWRKDFIKSKTGYSPTD